MWRYIVVNAIMKRIPFMSRRKFQIFTYGLTSLKPELYSVEDVWSGALKNSEKIAIDGNKVLSNPIYEP